MPPFCDIAIAAQQSSSGGSPNRNRQVERQVERRVESQVESRVERQVKALLDDSALPDDFSLPDDDDFSIL